jgi:hypothetical protein
MLRGVTHDPRVFLQSQKFASLQDDSFIQPFPIASDGPSNQQPLLLQIQSCKSYAGKPVVHMDNITFPGKGLKNSEMS